MHGQIWSLSKVLRQVFLINIRFCDFLNLPWFTPALVRGLGSILARKEMTKSNSLQKTVSYVIFLKPIKILSTKQLFLKLHILARFTCTAAFSRKVRSRAISREITIAQYIIACIAEVYFKPHNIYYWQVKNCQKCIVLLRH